jgi:hypothetical protein
MVEQQSRACLEDNFTGGIKQLLIRKYGLIRKDPYPKPEGALTATSKSTSAGCSVFL